jgi:hypothetical protein
MRSLGILLLAGALVWGQDPKKKSDGAAAPPPPGSLVDASKVDQAIKKGVEFLKTAPSAGAHRGIQNSDELLLFTFVHAGVSETEPRFQELLKAVREGPLEKTYKVALQAMILEELDRVKNQVRIWQCAQFLVDNQCTNGQWSYGDPVQSVQDVPTGAPAKGDVASVLKPPPGVKDFGGSDTGMREKPKVVKKIPVKKNKDGPSTGDNSNSQYAALGLRACHDAGITLPKETLELAAKWWRDSQDGASGGAAKDKKPGVTTGGDPILEAPPRGWGYKAATGSEYGSMTAGAVGALSIYDYMLDKKWKKDENVLSGMSWLAAHFSVTENPLKKEHWHYYYLYGLERAGMLYDTDKIGAQLWYPVGANYLLGAQQADGSWGGLDKREKGGAAWDTCFAILFLKRATRRLDVATEGGSKK